MMKPLAVHVARGTPANFLFRDLALIRHWSVMRAVTEGLQSSPKKLPAALFYDARGAQLFESITRTPEYYLTRTEASILTGRKQELAEIIDPGMLILEYGAGEMRKIRLLLAAALPARYVAVDISREQLAAQGAALARDFPQLLVEAVHADFADLRSGQLALPEDGKRLFFLPGSTIGNLEPRDAEAFLRRAAEIVRVGGYAIVGVDLCKDARVLERAYNDCGRLYGPVQLERAGQDQSRAQRRLRAVELRASCVLQRAGVTHRDASAQPLRPEGDGSGPAVLVCVRRNDPHRELL